MLPMREGLRPLRGWYTLARQALVPWSHQAGWVATVLSPPRCRYSDSDSAPPLTTARLIPLPSYFDLKKSGCGLGVVSG